MNDNMAPSSRNPQSTIHNPDSSSPNPQKITIFGAGYVGLVTGVCFAELGNDVVCVDVDQNKITQLQQGKSPIYEPGLTDMLQRNLAAGRIKFTTDATMGIQHGLLQFIAVGTPSDYDGSADLRYVLAVAKTIGEQLTDYRVIVTKSTVPVGTADKVRQTIQEQLQQRHLNFDFAVVSNPEFLKEGAAIADFMQPDRIVVGADNSTALNLLRQLYQPLIDNEQRFIAMDIRSSELTKYAANALLATKISFINEMSLLAERVGADIELIRLGIGSDSRIGPKFLLAGCGYGGSCFPKDVRALKKLTEQQGLTSYMLTAAEAVNVRQKQILMQKIKHHFNEQLNNKVIALWGLAFKPDTDDMREASSQVLIENLLAQGVTIQAYDPAAMPEAKQIYANQPAIKFCDTANAALVGADALVIVTEWQEFRQADLQLIKQTLRHPVIFDGRNLYDPLQLAEQGFIYYGIGRRRIK